MHQPNKNWPKNLSLLGSQSACQWEKNGKGPLNLNRKETDPTCMLLNKELSMANGIEEALATAKISSPYTNKKRGKKGKSIVPVEDSSLKRSIRVKGNAIGFKTSYNKNCPMCSPKIPTLSVKSLKKIGMELCDMKKDMLSNEVLMGKRKLEPVGKKMKKNKSNRVDKPQEGAISVVTMKTRPATTRT